MKADKARRRPAPVSISVRLLILALAILIPFQLGGLLLISQGQGAIRDEIKTTAKNSTRFTMDVLEREIEYLGRQLESLTSSAVMKDYIMRSGAMDPADFYSALNDQRELIRSLNLGNELVSDIVIYYRDSDKALSATQGYIDADAGYYSELAGLLRTKPGPVWEEGGVRYLCTLYPGSAIYTEQLPAYIIQMSLSDSYMRSLLATQSQGNPTLLYASATQSLQEVGATPDILEIFNAHKDEILGMAPVSDLETGNALVIAAHSSYLDYWLVQVVPKDQLFQVVGRFTVVMLLFSLLGILSLVVYTVISNRLIKKPVLQLLGGFKQVESGNLGATLPSDGKPAGEFGLLIEGFNHMSSQLATAVETLYAKELYAQRMELKQLQAQINPHFLYNTYFLLHRLIGQEDIETAERLSAYLGEYFQYITRNWQDRVPLSAEWRHAASYLEIQSLRFSSTLTVLIDIPPPQADTFMVPRLILQPLLENAIEYGVKGAENGRVEMRYREDGEYVRIEIRNYGKPVPDALLEKLGDKLQDGDLQSETTALTNIHHRIHLEFGPQSGLSASRTASGGLSMTLTMKKHTETGGGAQ